MQSRTRALAHRQWLGLEALSAMAVILVLAFFATTAAFAKEGTVERIQEGSVFLSGDFVAISEEIDGDLIATGETISIGHKAEINGNARLTARAVAIEGEIDGDVDIRAANALLNGEIKGNVTFRGSELTVGPEAEIGGNVEYTASKPAIIDDSAEIDGDIARVMGDAERRAQAWRDGEAGTPRDAERSERRADWAERRADRRDERRDALLDLTPPGYEMSLMGALFFALLAGGFAWWRPGSLVAMREAVAAAPAFAALVGLFWLVGLPVLAVLAAITIVGLPISVLLIFLWPIGMIAGMAGAVTLIASWLTGPLHLDVATREGRLIAIGIAAVLLWVAISIPVLGGIVWLAAVLAGVGGIFLAVRTRLAVL